MTTMPWMQWIDTFVTVLVIAVPIVILLIAAALFFYFVVVKRLMKKASDDYKEGSEKEKAFFNYFKKSKAKDVVFGSDWPTFKDVGGMPEVIEEVGEIVEFLHNPEKFTRVGARIPNGVLLQGEPGVGKTLLVKAIAGEAKVKFLSVSGSEFVEMLVGVGSSRVRDLFEEAKKNAPCIIFIDEIDAMGGKRSPMAVMGEKESQQTLNQLLKEMDGFERNSGVMVIAATNRQDTLDPALTRRGRFDRQYYISMPDFNGRMEILKIHLQKVKYDSGFDIERAARNTIGYSGADLESIVNEAAILAGRRDKNCIDIFDFDEAEEKVKVGLGRKGVKISEKTKKIFAYHEAGHAIVAVKSGAPVDVRKVTIVAHGGAGGFTLWAPKDEGSSRSKSEFRNLISAGLGGYAAEKIVFGDFTNGARNDIQRFTWIARSMVKEWGMSDEIGPISYSKENANIPGISGGGFDFGGAEICSEYTAKVIDKEVQNIIKDALGKAERILKENRKAADEVVELLIEKETIDGDEVKAILEKHNKNQKTEKQKNKKTEEMVG